MTTDSLTNQQELFCRLMVYGRDGKPLPAVDCYRAAYNYKGSNIHSRCFELRKNPKVEARIRELTLEKNRREDVDHERLRTLVIQRLELEALNDANAGAVRVRALQLIGDLVGVDLFKERSGGSSEKTVAELEEELKRLLEAAQVEGGVN